MTQSQPANKEESKRIPLTELPEPEGFNDGIAVFRIDGVEVISYLPDNLIMFVSEISEILQDLAEDDDITTKQADALNLARIFLETFVVE